jgi:Ca-activated chloride channel family protein
MRWLLAVLALVVPTSAAAQGWIEPLPGTRPAPLLQRVERVRTSVTVRVTDRVARVEVEEWFRNAGGGIAEGDYIYPLAGEAVFSDFSLFQGEDELKGETMDASRARAIYEEIVRRRRDPALIEEAWSRRAQPRTCHAHAHRADKRTICEQLEGMFPDNPRCFA